MDLAVLGPPAGFLRPAGAWGRGSRGNGRKEPATPLPSRLNGVNLIGRIDLAGQPLGGMRARRLEGAKIRLAVSMAYQRHPRASVLMAIVGSKPLISLVPDEGIEPPTFGLQNRCSTAELIRRLKRLLRYQRAESRARARFKRSRPRSLAPKAQARARPHPCQAKGAW